MHVINGVKGLVTKKFNHFFYVDIIENTQRYEVKRLLCKSRKNIYFKKNLIFVGDEVILNQINFKEKTAVIDSLLDRKNLLLRPSVANISNVYIINSVAEPELNYSQVSNFLVNAEFLQVQVSLILTKADLINDQRNTFLIQKFSKWGYKPRVISLTKNTKISDLINELKTKKRSIFVGPSGVGKTTLLNKIIPNLDRATSAVSKKIKRGVNTTRNIELFQLSEESYIVDTPGFNIQNNFMETKYIADLFPECQQKKAHCKFRNCLHIDEPGCNLNKNFERYEFYKKLISDSKNHYHQNQED